MNTQDNRQVLLLLATQKMEDDRITNMEKLYYR